MPKVPRDEAERNKKILAEMLRHAHNKECADCTAKAPTWSPWNWGVFVCIKCAGIHRKMGTHISKVKSCTLDDWFDNEAQLVRCVGNKVGEYLYAANLSRPKPDEHDDNAREDFIRNKYEKRLWMRKGGEQGAYGVASGAVVINSTDVPTSPTTPSSTDSETPRGTKKTSSTPTTPSIKAAPTPTKAAPTPTKATPSPSPAAPDFLSFGVSETSAPVSTVSTQQTTSSVQFPVSFETTPSPSTGSSDAKSSILSMFDQPKQAPVAAYPPQRPVGIPGVGLPQRPPAVYTGAYPPQGYPQQYPQQGYPQPVYYPPQGYPQGYPTGYPTTPQGGRGIPQSSPVYRQPVSPAGVPPQVYAQPPQQQMMYRTPTTPQMTYPYNAQK